MLFQSLFRIVRTITIRGLVLIVSLFVLRVRQENNINHSGKHSSWVVGCGHRQS